MAVSFARIAALSVLRGKPPMASTLLFFAGSKYSGLSWPVNVSCPVPEAAERTDSGKPFDEPPALDAAAPVLAL